ncbi:ABC transporter ATP-binding protein [Devosia nitrariae]|uniref:Sugar ABC transporter ATP-binding protein n=1 Tax=Devosia nitrariae TaxID=2071872 RepID=A0ABQ5WAB0_9HYPH|nr:ABC transporter ATP-binding protein [Devosia nitrariae]GLQ56880.1 sugar ABC transporter ATP-binding protein [Devosia nitrariae]
MSGLRLQDIRKSFGAVEVIRGVNLEIEHGEFVVFVGPSGCGKSTLLRMIAGLEDISGGTIMIGERAVNDVEPRDRGVAMVFQSYALYPHMSVYDNVGFNLMLSKVPKAERDQQIRAAARSLQMEHLLERKPGQLSGGQRQRVAIGRAIVRNPKVFLFDEPLSNLDAALRGDMRLELARLHRELETTIIYVTHDQVEAMTLADKIVVMDQGTVQQVGSPLDLYDRPANRFVAGFIGSPRMNFVEVVVEEVGAGLAQVTSRDVGRQAVRIRDGAVAAGDKLTLGIRPHQVDIKGSDIEATVSVVERLGHEAIVAAKLASGVDFTFVGPGDIDVTPGQECRFSLDARRTFLFNAAGEAVSAG